MDSKQVYEDFNWADFKFDSLKSKVTKVLENIPSGVDSILDVGCGNGLITNMLSQKYEVTAVDRSQNALKFVKCNKLQSSADNIPLPDNYADMVFSSELLEHLPEDVLKGTVAEIKRLSRKYIFITVPNEENPDKLSIKCPKCKYVYNSPNHLRSFSAKKLIDLFPEYNLIDTFSFGLKVRYYNPTLLKIKRKISPSNSWIPYYWLGKDKRDTSCPNCANRFYNSYKFNILSTSVDMINLLVSPKKPYWLFAIFELK